MSIPSKLWSIVFRFLDRRDLARVACTSSQLSSAARPILYQSVHLRSNKDGVQDTFGLIKADSSLASNITEIHLSTEWKEDSEEKAWLSLSAFSNLPHLRFMTMTGSPFQTAEEQESFFEIVAKCCPRLREFTYRQGRYPSPPFLPTPHPTKFPSINFQISGIERLVWDDNACFAASQPQLRSLMRASLQTISHLTLPSAIDDFGVADAITFYRQFRFPQLKSFGIGDWVDFNGEEGPVALVEFLIAHPTIQDLSLDWEDTSEYTPELSESAAIPNMLSNLRSLHCHVFNMLVMLRRGVRALACLEKLSVGHGLHPEAETQMDEMLKRLISNGGLPSLKSLLFDPGESCSDLQKTEQWISQWSQISPGLRKWSGSLPDMEVDALISNFSRFLELSRLGLSYTTIPRGADDVKTIASQLSSLKKVIVHPAGEINTRRVTYHIQRNELGVVSQLIIRKYNLCNHHVVTRFHRVDG